MADLRHQIQIKAAPAKVYAAIATQAGLRGWWTADSKTEDKAGGKAEFGFDKTRSTSPLHANAGAFVHLGNLRIKSISSPIDGRNSE